MASSTQIHLASPWKYDVFLSFRGTDTREGFSEDLYKALEGQTIKTFKDDARLKKGSLLSELLVEIEKSRFALIVFSPDYASSDWCLKELAKIHESKQVKTIIPIFYNVKPFHVKYQRGTYEQAFNKLKNDGRHSIEELQRWRTALTSVANISGWNLAEYGSEDELSDKIVEFVYKQLVCAGCNTRVGDGLDCLDALWHRECLRCKDCDQIFTELEFWNCSKQPYHSDCYERLCYVCNICKRYIRKNAQGFEYEENIWRQIYCASHVQDGTVSCCSCERLKPRDTTYYKLSDDRKLCPQCKDSIINTENGCRSICLEVQNFCKELNVKVEKIPLRLVRRQDIDEAIQGVNDGSDRQFPGIRAFCLLEERSSTSYIFWRRSKLCCEVKEILIWFGLPRILTGSLLAQQIMSAWLRVNRCPDLSPEVEKGICRYSAYMWLEYTSNSDSSRKLSKFEKMLVKFRKSKLHCSALLIAEKAVKKHGLKMTLKTIRKTGKFPSVDSNT